MIVVFGSLNVDVIIGVGQLPKAGETVLGPGYHLAAGGKGANQALAAARAGGNVTMVGAVGADPLADTALADLRTAGVDLARMVRVIEPTGLASICVDAAGENQIVVASGANRMARADQVPDALLGPATILVLQMETPPDENWQLVRRARSKGARILLNVAPAAALPAEIPELVDWLVGNETEAQQIARQFKLSAGDARAAAAAIAAHCATNVIVTLGGAGAEAHLKDGARIAVPALPIKPVDTVGAGDSFVGGLAAALDRGKSLAEALRYASVGGALACLKSGAQPSLPLLSDIESRLPELPA
ncbi:ribokinase [Dongia sp.]|uniref:ribokinase n=1 Tax=Dongia sp. TaxID=1977262 RepID=UPI0035AF451C